MNHFIGREQPFEQLKQIIRNDKPVIVNVYGRRRIGKTTLIEQALLGVRYIKLEGKQGQNKQQQIQHCLYTLSKYFKKPSIAKFKYTTWTELFDWIADKTKKGRWVLYLEELQWLASYEQELISDLKEVWDNRFQRNTQFVLILCGSSPSFMIANVVRSKALYNRSQLNIPLGAFSIQETAQFMGKRKNLNEIMDAYLSVGGIPEYLKYLKDESSVFLSLCQHSFVKGGYFAEEYEKIFTSSLSDNVYYRAIIEYLAARRFASRAEILKHLKIDSGGSITKIIDDLVLCEFVEEIVPFSSSAEGRLVRYAIKDNYLHFYYRFIAPKLRDVQAGRIKNPRQALSIDKYRQWLGYAFERWCRSHANIIADRLGFADVEYSSGAYFRRKQLRSDFQIDLIFDRKDRVLSVCEIKYTDRPLTTSVVDEFERKLEKLDKKKNQTVQRVLITACGAEKNLYNHFDRILTIQDLFSK